MKRVVKSRDNKTVELIDIDVSRIYILSSHGIYKAHSVGSFGKGWAFLHMDSSNLWASGDHDTLEDLIRDSLDKDIYEFNSLDEFSRWLYHKKSWWAKLMWWKP